MTVRRDHTTTIFVNTEDLRRRGLIKADAGDIRFYQDPGHKIEVPYVADQSTIPGTASRFDLKVTVPSSDYHTGIANYWSLDGGTASDVISGQDGTIVGTLDTVPGQVDEALAFDDDVNNHITLPDSVVTALEGLSAITVECWFRPNSIGALQRLVQLNSSSTRFTFFLTTLGEVQVAARSSDADTVQNATSTETFSAGDWLHIVAGVNLATPELFAYVNGVKLTGFTTPTFSQTTFDIVLAGPHYVGRDAASGTLNGILDNLALYHRELTADEVYSSYVRGLNGKRLQELRPTFYLSMDSKDNAGSEIVDVVNGLNGTINGTVAIGQAGRVGQSFKFDGLTGYVEIADSPLMEPHVGSSGVSTWLATVNWDGSSSGAWLSKIRGNTNQREFFLEVDASGRVLIHYGTLTNSARGVILSPVAIPANITTHIAITYDASLPGTAFIDKISIFVDGTQTPVEEGAPDIGSFTAMSSGTEPLRIGKWIDGAGNDQSFWPGIIEDVLWVGGVLSDADIATLADRSRQGLRPDLEAAFLANTVGYWSLDNKDIGIEPQDSENSGKVFTVNGPLLVGQPGLYDDSDSFRGDGSSASLRGPNTQLADAFFYAETGEGTRSIWFRRPATPALSGNEYMFFLGRSLREDSIRMNSSGSIVSQWTQNDTLPVDTEGPSSGVRTYNDGEWHHVVSVVSRGATDYIILYVDGIEVGRDELPVGWENNLEDGASVSNTRRAFFQRWDAGTSDGFFNGYLSDFMWIKGYALTSEEVQDLYQKGRAGVNPLGQTQRIYPVFGDSTKNDASNPANTYVRQVSGVVSAYTFDESQGGGVTDAVAGADLSLVGKALVDNDRFGFGRTFEGGGVFDAGITVLPVGDKALFFRVKTTTLEQVLFSNYDGDADNNGLSIELTSGLIRVRHATGTGTNNALSTGTTNVADGQFHNILVTLDNTGQTIGIYVDGSVDEATSPLMTAAESVAGDSLLRVGGYREIPFSAPTGLVLRLEADQIDTGTDLDADGLVSTWPDASSSANDATQATATVRPLYLPEGIGGRPSVVFHVGTGMVLSSLIDFSTSNSDYTIFAVIEPLITFDGTTSNNFLLGKETGDRGAIAFNELTGSLTDEVISSLATISGTVYGVGVSGITFPAGSPFLATWGLAGSTEDIRIATVDQSLIVSSNGGLDSSLGRSQVLEVLGGSSTGTASLEGKVGAVLIFDNRLSAADTDYVERYLALKYGVPNSTVFGATRGDMTIGDLRVLNRVPTLAEITDMMNPNNYLDVISNTLTIRKRFDPEIVTENT